MSHLLDLAHRSPCVDLRRTFGRAFKFVMDPAAQTERSDFRGREAAWLTRIPCRYGYVFPWGGRQLAGYSSRRGLFARLRAIPGATVRQHGDRELVVTFDVEDLEAVAALLQARRPVRLSLEERERRRESGRRLAEAFPPGKKGGKPPSESTNGIPDDAEAVLRRLARPQTGRDDTHSSQRMERPR